MFENVAVKPARSIVVVKRAFQLIVITYLVIGLIAFYRMWFQVRSLEVHASDSILRPGSTIETNLGSYARTPIEVRLELVQGAHAETFALLHLPDNDWAFLDPRPRQASQTNVLTAAVLSRFEKGKALVRATALGRPQLSRTPPPVVREVAVEIQ
jgi:hypothetical protein